MNTAPVLIDTNLLLLFVVGSTDLNYVKKHKRLTEYIEEDFDQLTQLMARASKVVISPTILSETSNLAAQIGEPAKTEIFLVFRELINKLEEKHIPSKVTAARHEFPRLGLTDCSAIEEAKNGAVVITVDLDLYVAVVSQGGEALNFNHLREQYL